MKARLPASLAVALLACIASFATAAHDPASSPAAAARATRAPDAEVTVSLEGSPDRQITVDDALFAALPKSSVMFDDHGEKATFEGVELAKVLERAGAPSGRALRGEHLAYVVVVAARDGYRAVFALAELDAAIGGKAVTLARLRDGRPLSAEEGPYRLVVPSDARAARSVRQVSAIRVVKVE